MFANLLAFLFGSKVRFELMCRATGEKGTEPREFIIAKNIRLRAVPSVGEHFFFHHRISTKQVDKVIHCCADEKMVIVQLKETVTLYDARMLMHSSGWAEIDS